MTTRASAATIPAVAGDRRFVVLTALLACALAAGILVNWWVAAGIVAVSLLLALRPLQPLSAVLVATMVATFVNNEGGHLTRELSVVAVLLAYALFCVLAAAASGRWSLPRAPLTTAVLALEVSTLAAAAHGVLAGNNLRYLGLELLPLLGLTIAIMVGGLSVRPRDLRGALRVLNLVSLGHVALGFANYVINRRRSGGIWFTPVPGLMALLLFNLALRRERGRDRIGLILLTAVNLLHQLISLTRGYWLGLAAGLLLSTVLYVGRGEGARRRALRVLGICGWLAGLATVGAIVVGALFGWGDLAAMFGTRLASSLGMEQTSETASNFERVLEWVVAARQISAAPWFGHGLGYTLHVHYPIIDLISTQWFLHQLYLLMWVKQGLVGFVLLITVLGVAARTGMRNAQRLTGDESAWSAGAAAGTAYIAALALTNYPMAQVNSTFLMVLLWGITLSLGRPPRWKVVWRSPPPPALAGAPGR